MNRKNQRELYEKRISKGYFPNSMSTKSDLMIGHSFLFVRDLPLGIMPMRHRRGDVTWSVALEPEPTPERTEWITTLLEVSETGGRDLASAVVAFVEEICRELAYNGETFYEIVTEDSDDRPLTHLLSLPFGRMRQRRGIFFQCVPEADRGVGDPSEIAIPADKIWHMALPRVLGEPDQHRALLAELVKLSNPMPKFALESTQLGTDSGYDFATHRRAQEIAIEHAMARWGTVPSVRHLEGTTEYFFIARTLQFARSQALIREHIIEEFNLLLVRMGMQCRIVVRGLPTAETILKLMQSLDKGKIDFKTAMDAVAM